MLETGKDMDPRSREILQTGVWWGQVCAPHHTKGLLEVLSGRSSVVIDILKHF